MSLLVLGANSLIAQCTAECFAKDKHEIIFAGRNAGQMQKLANDFEIRFQCKAYGIEFDALDYNSHKTFLENVLKLIPQVDYVLLAFGYLGEQTKANEGFDESKKIIETNYTGAVSIIHLFASHFESQRKGNIIIISSVAGDRGRQSNYLYGSAKAGLSAFAQGLRSRLFKSGVHVLTVKPGFVDTPMTYGMPLPKLLVASPKKVGKDIYKAALKKKNILYTPFYWRFIMMIVKSIPEFIFKKLKL